MSDTRTLYKSDMRPEFEPFTIQPPEIKGFDYSGDLAYELRSHQLDIDRLFASDDVEAIVAALAADGSEFATTTGAAIGRMSPTSLKITARQLTTNRGISPLDALALEYRMVLHVLERHDFYEGIRAALVDKDRNPQWEPATLAGVSASYVEVHFAPLGDAELALP